MSNCTTRRGGTRVPKLRHADLSEAYQHAYEMGRRYPSKSFNVYQCTACQRYHIGRKPKDELKSYKMFRQKKAHDEAIAGKLVGL